MMHEVFGRRDGLCGGKGGSMHIADLDKGMLGANAIVGGAPPFAVGAALAAVAAARRAWRWHSPATAGPTRALYLKP